MRDRIRKISALFFLSIFAFNMCVYYMFIGVSDLSIKHSMQQDIAHSSSLQNIEIIKVPIASANLFSDDEVTYQHRLYDVVKKEVKGSNVWVYVIHDSKEENLISKLAVHIEHEFGNIFHSTGTKPVKSISKLLAQDYVPNRPGIVAYTLYIQSIRPLQVHEYSTVLYFHILIPPPKRVA